MTKQKKRAARKRMEKRRERRRKRDHSGGSHPDAFPEGHLDIRTWVTDPLAMAVSGRITVMSQVNLRSGSWLIGTIAGLLEGGYLGTFDVRLRKQAAPEDMARLLFKEIYEDWGVYLRPAPVTLASRLVWGALAYSCSRGIASIDALGALPAMGYLQPPPGTVGSWSVDFVRRFGTCQVSMGDQVAAEFREALDAAEDAAEGADGARGAWPGGPGPEPVRASSSVAETYTESEILSDLLIISYVETETPLSMRAELDRHAAEFVFTGNTEQGSVFRWMVAPSSLVTLDTPHMRGMVYWRRDGRVELTCLDATSAAALIMRLKDLVPSLHLRHCHWERASAYASRALVSASPALECGEAQSVRSWNMR